MANEEELAKKIEDKYSITTSEIFHSALREAEENISKKNPPKLQKKLEEKLVSVMVSSNIKIYGNS